MQLVADRTKFWNLYRAHFPGIVTVGTFNGLTLLLDRFEKEARLDNVPQFAYVLATAYHESGKLVTVGGRKVFERFVPVREGKAAPGSEVWQKYQSKYWDAGYWGRGLAQTTHKENYLKVGQLVGVGDLFVRQPDLLLEGKWAYEALVAAMVFGIYRRDARGRQNLDRYFPGETASFNDYYNAREIINGDKNIKRKGAAHTMGHEIAVIAQKFEKILKGARAGAPAGSPSPPTQNSARATGFVSNAQILIDQNNSTDRYSTDPADGAFLADVPSVSLADLSQPVGDVVSPQNGSNPATPALDPPNTDDSAPPDNSADSVTMNVEDWKPWVYAKLKLIWKTFTGANLTQTVTNAIAALKSGEYWYVPVIVAVACFILTLIVAAVATAVVLGIWYVSRKEINRAKMLEAESALNPLTPSLRLKVEKIEKGLPLVRRFLPA